MTDPRDDAQAEAQARLDQIRTQAGGAVSGEEIARRMGDDPGNLNPEPPLDWRMTPRNILLQVVAVAIFIGVVWFLATLLLDSWTLLFSRPEGGS